MDGSIRAYPNTFHSTFENPEDINPENILWAINYQDNFVYEFKCCSTNLSNWKDIPPELRTLDEDHIEGVHGFNVKENIQTICKNCHTLKTRYCSDDKSPSYDGNFLNFESDYRFARELVNILCEIMQQQIDVELAHRVDELLEQITRTKVAAEDPPAQLEGIRIGGDSGGESSEEE